MPLSVAKPILRESIQLRLEPEIESISEKAFYDAMKKFRDETIKQTGNTGKDVFNDLNDMASKVFSNEMKKLAEKISEIISDEVNTFTLSASIIIPPGQALTTAGTAVAQSGATIAPSPPATIS